MKLVFVRHLLSASLLIGSLSGYGCSDVALEPRSGEGPFIPSLNAGSPTVSVLMLGTLGGSESEAFDVNESGLIVGGAQNLETLTQATYWTVEIESQSAMASDMGVGTFFSEALAVNDFGVATGNYFADLELRSFTWTSGGFDDVGDPGSGSVEIRGINNGGDLVGRAGEPVLKDVSVGLGWISLPSLADFAGKAVDLNDARVIVGFTPSTSGSAASQAVLWEEGNTGEFTPVGLGYLENGNQSEANAINSFRVVVGWSNNDVSSKLPVKWDPQGAISPLGTLGGNRGVAHDVNDVGVVVGESRTSDGDDHATMWTPTGEVIDLSANQDVLGSVAYAINETGWIVGVSDIDVDGQSRKQATLWVVTEVDGSPSTIEELKDALTVLIDDGVLTADQGNSLLSKLDAAEENVDAGRYDSAGNILGAFINQVEAFLEAGILTEEQAGPLIEGAQSIIDGLLTHA